MRNYYGKRRGVDFSTLLVSFGLLLFLQSACSDGELDHTNIPATLSVLIEDEQPIKGKYTILVGARKDSELLEIKDSLTQLCKTLPSLDERWLRIYTNSRYYSEDKYRILGAKIPFMTDRQTKDHISDVEEITANYIAEYHPDIRSLVLFPLSLSPQKLTMEPDWCSAR